MDFIFVSSNFLSRSTGEMRSNPFGRRGKGDTRGERMEQRNSGNVSERARNRPYLEGNKGNSPLSPAQLNEDPVCARFRLWKRGCGERC